MSESRSWRRPIIGMALGVAMLAALPVAFGLAPQARSQVSASLHCHSPVTRKAFVISGLDRVLAAFDERGSVTGYALLSSRDFPEGITFLPNGSRHRQ